MRSALVPGMKTTTTWRTEATDTITVSTVHVREGRLSWYETAFIVAGRVSEPRRVDRKFAAGVEHDACVAAARGYADPHSKRGAELAAFLAE